MGERTQRTRRTHSRVILTELSLVRATSETIDSMCDDFRRLGGAERWVIDAMAVRSYGAAAVTRASNRFAELSKENGLCRVHAAVSSPLVRMAANVVAMTLQAGGYAVGIEIAESREAAIAAATSSAAAR